MEQSKQSNPEKMLSVIGFLIGLTGIIGGAVVAIIAIGDAGITGGGNLLAISLAVYTLLGFVLSFMGRKKSKAAGAKSGLAIIGMIAGIIGIGVSIAAIEMVQQAKQAKVNQDSAVKTLVNDKVGMDDEAQHMIDSMNAANGAGADSAH